MPRGYGIHPKTSVSTLVSQHSAGGAKFRGTLQFVRVGSVHVHVVNSLTINHDLEVGDIISFCHKGYVEPVHTIRRRCKHPGVLIVSVTEVGDNFIKLYGVVDSHVVWWTPKSWRC
ncbi:hypothetical protein DPMN_054965 [Dreissena polymorpha]|uniref:Uncharacterized protein n=1 Tax=Dreissena polymorpha TaxID=45954 RepID=A0A9D4CPW0_DREPO|nr:hypothetical protein DPMN_054965 [Dreissena polymorpha]